jgi:hypothetical protein
LVTGLDRPVIICDRLDMFAAVPLIAVVVLD